MEGIVKERSLPLIFMAFLFNKIKSIKIIFKGTIKLVKIPERD